MTRRLLLLFLAGCRFFLDTLIDNHVGRYRIQYYSKKFQVTVTSEFLQEPHRIGIDKYEVLRK